MNDGSGTIEVLLLRLPGNDLPAPAQSTAHASGFDLRACVVAPIKLEPGSRALIPTGFAVALPEGWEAQIRPRSGLAFKQGVTMLNSPGTIDADYRGEVQVLAINHGGELVTIERGDRIAQMVIAAVPRVTLREVGALPQTDRGAGGFGHTGSR